MFRCDKCGRSVGPHIQEVVHIIEQRKKEYPARSYTYKKKDLRDRGGKGKEIAKTQRLCPFCANDVNEETDIGLSNYIQDKKSVMPRTVMMTDRSEQ
jgi:CRISPR/Cas system-associated protein Cas10 (large subunit of type III CRISPR-Cas system)